MNGPTQRRASLTAAFSLGPLRPAQVSAVPSIIGRVRFWGSTALKAGVDPGISWQWSSLRRPNVNACQ